MSSQGGMSHLILITNMRDERKLNCNYKIFRTTNLGGGGGGGVGEEEVGVLHRACL